MQLQEALHLMAVGVQGSVSLGSKALNSICLFLMKRGGGTLYSFDVDCLGP